MKTIYNRIISDFKWNLINIYISNPSPNTQPLPRGGCLKYYNERRAVEMFSALVFFIAVVVLTIVAEGVIEEKIAFGEKETKGFVETVLGYEDNTVWWKALIMGALTGLVVYAAPRCAQAPGWATIMLLAMLGVMAYLPFWWAANGTVKKEMICFILLELLFAVVVFSVCLVLIEMISSPFLVGLLKALPYVAFLAALLCFVLDTIGWSGKETEEELKKRNLRTFKYVAIAVALIILAIILMSSFSGTGASLKSSVLKDSGTNATETNTSQEVAGNNGDSFWSILARPFRNEPSRQIATTTTEVEPTLEPTPAPTPAPEQLPLVTTEAEEISIPEVLEATPEPAWYGFYSLLLLDNKDEEDDFNFGPNPSDSSWKAKDYHEEFKSRMEVDPALGAAAMAWVDCLTGNRYIGVFYDACSGDWAGAINQAKENFMADHDYYYSVLHGEDGNGGFFAFLDHAKYDVKKGSGIKDQMYMNPFTADGIPDVIVMKSDHDKGYFLRYHFTVKGRVIEVPFRIACGFQPCNVSKAMGITPTSRPSGGGNGGNGGGGTDKPTPPPKKLTKDPTQGTVVGSNNTTGAGNNTSGKPGNTTSTADEANGSSSNQTGTGATTSSGAGSYENYQAAMGDLAAANPTPTPSPKPTAKPPASASTPTPSPKPSPTPAVDNPGGTMTMRASPSPSAAAVAGDGTSSGMLGEPGS